MNATEHWLGHLGYTGLFLCLFLEQIGLPVPGFAALIAVGAVLGNGTLEPGPCILVGTVACVLPDLAWYFVGRRSGNKVLFLICKLSWKPDTCVQKTAGAFVKTGPATLLFAKFVPALSVLGPPLAGLAKVRLPIFLAYDVAGTLAYVAIPLFLGSYVKRAYAVLTESAQSMYGPLPWLLGLVVALVLIWKFYTRWRYRQRLERGLVQALQPGELKDMLEKKVPLTLVDIRNELSVRSKPVFLPGAKYLPYHALKKSAGRIRRDETVVIYCDCPDDEAAVDAAAYLHARGIASARALRHGLQGWIAEGFDVHNSVSREFDDS